MEASVVEPAKAGGKEEAEKTDVGGQQGVGKHRKSKVDKTSGETTRAEKGKGKQLVQVYPLPPSFSERASPAYLDYKLTVTVKKGAFRVNQTLVERRAPAA